MIIPHIIDQFVWNRIIYNMGAGPKGIKIGKITTKNLEPRILELVNNTSFKKIAEKVASQMEKENFREDDVDILISAIKLMHGVMDVKKHFMQGENYFEIWRAKNEIINKLLEIAMEEHK